MINQVKKHIFTFGYLVPLYQLVQAALKEK